MTNEIKTFYSRLQGFTQWSSYCIPGSDDRWDHKVESGAVFDWPHLQPVLIAGISAALSYLVKSLSTNSHNQLFRKEPA